MGDVRDPADGGVVAGVARVEVDAPLVGRLGVGAAAVPRVELDGGHLHRPEDLGDLGDAELVGGAVPAGEVHLHGLQPRRRAGRDALLVHLLAGHAGGEAVQHAGPLAQRVDDPVAHREVVVGEVPLGLAARREVDPVGVAQPHDAVVDLQLHRRALRGRHASNLVEPARADRQTRGDDLLHLAHVRRLRRRLRAVRVVEAGAGVRRHRRRPQRARPRGVHDPVRRDRAPAAVHRGPGRPAGQEPAALRPAADRPDPRRGGRAAAVDRGDPGRRPAGGPRATGPAGWCWPTRRATSSACCAATPSGVSPAPRRLGRNPLEPRSPACEGAVVLPRDAGVPPWVCVVCPTWSSRTPPSPGRCRTPGTGSSPPST